MGKIVNLAAYMIPEYEVAQDKTVHVEGVQFILKAPTDAHLIRQLTITAFRKFKCVMCRHFPFRHIEPIC